MGMVYIALGLITGSMLASQGAINGRLASHAGGPAAAALISMSIGLMALKAVNLLSRGGLPSVAGVSSAPWWAFMGGLIGAFGLTSAAFTVPQVGVATWVACVIAGQLVCAILLDQLGAFGQTVRDITPLRLLGVACLAAGVFLVRRY